VSPSPRLVRFIPRNGTEFASSPPDIILMRVLITTQPESGHWHPLVPLARALDAAGHDVAFASTPAGCAAIAANGFRCLPVGTDESKTAVTERRARLADLAPEDRASVFWSEVFPKVRAEQVLPDLLAVVRAWQPSVVVRDFLEFAGCVAAEGEGIPHAAVQVAAWRPRLHSLLIPPLDHLRESVGLSPDPDLAMPYRYLMLATAPLSFRGPASPLPPTARSLRPVVFDQSGQEQLPAWVEHLEVRPTVYATMGTVVNQAPGILEAIVTGLREEPITLIVTTGRDRDPLDFGPQQPNVHLERYVPQSLLFPYCDLVITHGGTGTVMAALGYGLPMVILPVAADQPDNARRCVDIGVAEAVTIDARTPETIRAAARKVLADPRYQENAARLRDEIQAMPGPSHAVALLERLAAERHVPEIAGEPGTEP
jgi:UDP:flavonoid glycosyltransferase YjiC (YdhE family)